MARFPEDWTKMFLWDYFDWCQLFLLFGSNFFQSNKYLKTLYLLSVNFTPRPSKQKVQNTTLEIHTGSICSSPAAYFEKCHPKPSLFSVIFFFRFWILVLSFSTCTQLSVSEFFSSWYNNAQLLTTTQGGQAITWRWLISIPNHGLWAGIYIQDFGPLQSKENFPLLWPENYKHSNTFFQEPNKEIPQLFRHLFWDLACAHNLDFGSIVYSLCYSPVHLLTLFLHVSLSSVPQSFPVSQAEMIRIWIISVDTLECHH